MLPFVLKGHERPVTIVRLNYDGDLFFSGSAQNKINLWESYTGERIGSYATKASVRSLDVDIHTKYLIACSNDGTLEVFDVETGALLKQTRIPHKLKQVEFNCGSTHFLLLHDEFIANSASKIRIIELKKLLSGLNQIEPEDKILGVENDPLFSTLVPNQKKPNKNSTRALWYIDNKTLFVSTQDGFLIHYNLDGSIINKTLLHDSTKINSMAFSKDFTILATAADNGSKIIDPETFQVLRIFKEELPMNAVSISPLFCSQFYPKFHMVMGGGVSAVMAAMTAGNAGFQAHVCNIMHGNEVGRISGHFGPINSLEFFRDGRGFISGGEQGIIRVVRFNEVYFEENNPQFE